MGDLKRARSSERLSNERNAVRIPSIVVEPRVDRTSSGEIPCGKHPTLAAKPDSMVPYQRPKQNFCELLPLELLDHVGGYSME
jgi:hypothetical protein